MILVEHQPHVNPALDRVLKRAEDDSAGSCGKPQVVHRELERPVGAVEECCNPLRHDIRGLAAIGEKEEFQRGRDRCDGGYRASTLGSPVSARGGSAFLGSST